MIREIQKIYENASKQLEIERTNMMQMLEVERRLRNQDSQSLSSTTPDVDQSMCSDKFPNSN